MVRPREGADLAAAREFLARHDSLRVARLGELVHPLDHPALVAVAASGQLLGMLTYTPGPDWRQCEILTLHAGEQWRGAGTALIEAAMSMSDPGRCRPAARLPCRYANRAPARLRAATASVVAASGDLSMQLVSQI